ncbi:pyridoxal phosphate-dependent aminotransferase [Streptomyces sp. NPDC046805]|uniref:pyridoxal phosphate-dependent aminotransferase n=1 Tax=Streptomyces sp. NPDC046805 TaxID=3155134 RepID=UPI0033D4C910
MPEGRLPSQRSLMTLLREEYDPFVADLGIGEPRRRPPQALASDIEKVLRAEATGYGPVAGLAELRNLIAERHEFTALKPTSVENVLVTTGATQAIYLSLLVATDGRGGEVLYPDPGFVQYVPAIRLVGAEPVPYRLPPARQFRLTADDIIRHLGAHTRAVVVNSPSNPLGHVIEREQLEMLVAECARRNILVVSDEVYEFQCWDKRHVSAREFGDNVLVCSGVSKLFQMAGWRIGWAIGSEPLVQRLLSAAQYITFRPSTVGQQVALSVLGAPAAMEQLMNETRQRRRAMAQALAALPGMEHLPQAGGLFFYVNVGNCGTDWDVALDLAKRGVAVVPSVGPGAGFGDQGFGWIRLSFAGDMRDVTEGMAVFAEYATEKGSGLA